MSIVAKWSPISATAELLLYIQTPNSFVFRPRLDAIMVSKVAVVGVIYFIMSSVEGFMRASVVSHFTLALRQVPSALMLLVIEVRVFSGLAVC